MAPLIQGRDGALYGTTSDGGASTNGTVFKVSTNGLDYTVLHVFSGTGGDGRHPYAGLVQGSDGVLYGTTSQGGASNCGAVFLLNPDGSGYSVRYSFTGTGGDGRNPEAELIQGNDGAFYGTTRYGGATGYGTVFKLNGDGSGYNVLHSFGGTSGDGRNPRAGLIVGRDGALYGTTFYGGAYTNWGGVVYTNWGTVFKLQPDGTGYSVLYSFKGSQYDAAVPQCALAQGADGALYGTATAGGYPGNGAIFKLNPDGSGYTVLYGFNPVGTFSGWKPQAGLIQGPDGWLYGTTAGGMTNYSGAVFRVRTNGLNFATLHAFGTNLYDGESAQARLVQANDGALYGTTVVGGACGVGTVFRVATNGTGYSSLFSFFETDPLGQPPRGELVQGSDGTLYGITGSGGGWGGGTVFKVSANGTAATLLHGFRQTTGEGWAPTALVAGGDGALYGTTVYGGTNACGTVFRINTNGTGFTLLHQFGVSGVDGKFPSSGQLVQGSGSAFYGATAGGGTNGAGSVFKLSPDGTGYQILHSFNTNGVDGENPYAGVIQAADGALYGTTAHGGFDGCGIVFRLGTDGANYTILHSFSVTGGDGYSCDTALVQATDGALYGTCGFGGANGYGTCSSTTLLAVIALSTASPTPSPPARAGIRSAGWLRARMARYTVPLPTAAPTTSARSSPSTPTARASPCSTTSAPTPAVAATPARDCCSAMTALGMALRAAVETGAKG